jgi:sigma-B regulation protein RsbU (phosphoserine phosphatase)
METVASLDRLKFCNFKLKTLLNFTQAINHNLPTEELLFSYEKLLKEELNIGKVLLFGFNKTWDIILKSGIDEKDYSDISVENDLLYLDEINITLSLSNQKLRPFDFVIPVFHNSKPLAYVLIGDVDEEQEGISPSIKHLHFIQTLTNLIVVSIENKRLVEENVQQARMKKELEMAAIMQEMLVPDEESFPQNKFISIHPFYLPHLEVGGDYYDFDTISDHLMYFCVADVSGKGMPAALLMSNFQANLKALFTQDTLIEDLIHKLNKIVIKNAHGENFITFFMGKYNYNSKVLLYVNAGHNPPAFYNKNTNEISYLTKGCTGIGMLDEIPKIEIGKIVITDNSKLLCFTDGLSELSLDGKEDYGQMIAEECLSNSNSIKETFTDLIEKLQINKENTAIFDDITILGLEFFI